MFAETWSLTNEGIVNFYISVIHMNCERQWGCLLSKPTISLHRQPALALTSSESLLLLLLSFSLFDANAEQIP
jgi:hypothetical protein